MCYNIDEVTDMIRYSKDWKDYRCLDAGDGEKLEVWGKVTVRRPDPVAFWPKGSDHRWNNNDATYHRSKTGGGAWEIKKKFADYWSVSYRDLTFKVSLTAFKHTGLFPEQAVNWDWMRDRIKMSENKNLRILNLFAYTGGATMAAAMESNVVEVVHVDAAKGMVEWAKENAKLSKLEDKHIRYIVDDVVKFVQREARRGRTYHGIILDPPSYGRGPNGEMWKLEDQLVPLIKECMEILDKDALFLILNSYTTGLSVTAIENILKTTILSEFDGQVEVSEIGNAIELRDLVLPCGVTGLWFR